MINHFKAEFYKLRHSKILITILGVCAAVIMVSFAPVSYTHLRAHET